MKNLSVLLLLAAILLGCLAGCGTPSEGESMHESKSESQSESTPEEDKTVNFDVNDPTLQYDHNGVNYFNVSAASKGKPPKGNDDKYFPEDAAGYYIEKGTYSVTADVFYRIVNKPFAGDGSIKFIGWLTGNYTDGDTHIFDGIIPISKLNDPLWVVMNSPNEGSNYRGDHDGRGQQNGDTLVPSQQKHIKIIPIGAIYLDASCELPDETPVTICFGSMTGALKMKGEDWKSFNDLERPANIDCLYPLPWQLEYDVKRGIVPVNQIPGSQIKQVDDHFEVSMTLGDFRRKDGENEHLVGRVLHFWGVNYNFENGMTGADMEGVATNYKAWIKEENVVGYITADVGADLRNAAGSVDQSFATKNFILTTEPRDIFGHNLCPLCYDTIMDTEKVSKILKLN